MKGENATSTSCFMIYEWGNTECVAIVPSTYSAGKERLTSGGQHKHTHTHTHTHTPAHWGPVSLHPTRIATSSVRPRHARVLAITMAAKAVPVSPPRLDP